MDTINNNTAADPTPPSPPLIPTQSGTLELHDITIVDKVKL